MRRKSPYIYFICFLFIFALPAISFGTHYRVDSGKPGEIAEFSGEGEDFNQNQAIHLCPFDAASAQTKLYEKLSTLRQVREKRLKQTKRGEKYVQIFGLHAAELAQIVLTNPSLASDVRDLTRLLIPIAEELLQADITRQEVLIDDQTLARIKIISFLFEEKASPKLKKQIIKSRFELDEYANKTVAQTIAYLHGFNPVREAKKLKQLIPKLQPVH
jgi:hypothetical protein